MPITIDEITADVAPPEPAPDTRPRAEGQAPPALDPRRLREALDRLEVRACRVRAD